MGLGINVVFLVFWSVMVEVVGSLLLNRLVAVGLEGSFPTRRAALFIFLGAALHLATSPCGSLHRARLCA